MSPHDDIHLQLAPEWEPLLAFDPWIAAWFAERLGPPTQPQVRA